MISNLVNNYIMKKAAYLFSILLIFSFFTTEKIAAQSLNQRDSEFLNIASPNVASFNKFIDSPISLYNGQPDINIPIYTLKDGVIELPIVLRYNTSGIKLSEDASWVGLGWNLNVGGQINQQAVGYLDNFQNTIYTDFFHQLLNKNDAKMFSTTKTEKGFAYLACNWNLYLDYIRGGLTGGNHYTIGLGQLEPDVFYFAYPGNSGKFVIDYQEKGNYKAVLLKKEQDLRIDLVKDGFNITTPEGIIHSFEVRLSGENYRDVSSVLYTLRESLYPNGQKVVYDYELIDTDTYIPPRQTLHYYSNRGVMDKSEADQDIYLDWGSGGSIGYPQKDVYIKSIKTDNYEIVFSMSEREDIDKKLDAIEIKCQKESIHKFEFKYDYWRAAPIASSSKNVWAQNLEKEIPKVSNWVNKRLKLLEISEVKDNNKYNLHKFHYNDIYGIIPRKDSYGVDYWGYYNHQISNSMLIPDVGHLFMYDTYDNEQIFYSYSQNPSYRSNSYSYSADRRFSPMFASLFMLKGIEYPTGGYLEYTYEPNEFKDLGVDQWEVGYNAGTPHLIAPLRIQSRNPIIFSTEGSPEFSLNKTISLSHKPTKYDEKGVSKQFSVSVFKTFGELNIRIMRNPYVDWINMIQCPYNVEIQKKDNTGQYKHYLGWYQYENMKDEDYYIKSLNVRDIVLEQGEYLLSVKYPTILTDKIEGFIDASLSYVGGVSITDIPTSFKGCGFRVKSIKLYKNIESKSLDPLTQTSYEYPAGMLHSIIDYASITNILHNPSKRPNVYYFTDKITISSYNLVSNPYGYSFGVGYPWVRERREGESGRQYVEYKFKNEKGTYKFRQGGIKQDALLNGKLYEKLIYNADGYIQKQEKYNFSSNRRPNVTLWGINWKYANFSNNILEMEDEKYFYSLSLGKLLYKKFLPGYGDVEIRLRHFQGDLVNMYKYDVPCYDTTLDSEETIIDGITTRKEYTYNPQTLQLKSARNILNGKQSLENKYSYPNDYSCGIYKDMVDKHIISPVIETQTYRDGRYIGGNITEYSWTKDGRNIKPSKKYFSELTAKVVSPVGFDCSGVSPTLFPIANIEYMEYDSYGNPTHISKNGIEQVLYLWSYNGQYPIAEIRNASYSDVEAVVKSAFGVSSINALSSLSTVTFAQLEKLRCHVLLKDALIITYTYNPLIGMASSTEPSGKTTYYNYDSFGRLDTVLFENNVKEKDVIEAYKYNYAKPYEPLMISLPQTVSFDINPYNP